MIDIPKEIYDRCREYRLHCGEAEVLEGAVANGTPIPKGHGRLGDLDELEQRISNFVEYDANITDEYTVARQRFIIDGIKQTPTIIEAEDGT